MKIKLRELMQEFKQVHNLIDPITGNKTKPHNKMKQQIVSKKNYPIQKNNQDKRNFYDIKKDESEAFLTRGIKPYGLAHKETENHPKFNNSKTFDNKKY